MLNNNFNEQKLRKEIWDCLITSIDLELDLSEKMIITPSLNIRKDIGLSSLSMIVVMFNLEEKYDINLVNVAPEYINTLKDVEDIVVKLIIDKDGIND